MLRYLPMFLFFCFIYTGCKEAEVTTYQSIIPQPDSVSIQNYYSKVATLTLPDSILEGVPGLGNFIGETDFMGMFSFTKEGATIELNYDEDLDLGAYALVIEKDHIHLSYSSAAGLQYGLVSLSQLHSGNGGNLPLGQVEDRPRFQYRGMHLDVGRHFFDKEDVKKYLDFLAYYKFNTFHWHLTEDQGWRIEIKKYPKLTEIGGYRNTTIIGHNSSEPATFDSTRYGGFYTQDDIREVVAYAADRNIEVIPEIELPGHSTAALAAYPELGCGPGPYEVVNRWGVFPDIFCPKEETFTFLEGVFDEVISLFPSKYIHIGGDEAPKDVWKTSKVAQDLIKKENLNDEHGLQSYFIQRIEKYLNSKGRQIIGWDEILEGGLAPNATVMSWRGEAGGIEAARQNHNVIMTPTNYAYLDYYQADPKNEPLAIGGLLTVKDVYHWEPLPKDLEADKHKYILGAQGNLWTEYIPTFSHLEYMVLARMTAVSEVVWSRPTSKDYDNYVSRLSQHVSYWKEKEVNIADHAVRDLEPTKITE